ncbi:hypothetical protein E4U43_001079 [Claviceps pusilla]|uniref:Uncharacterized protein n=1 Tax=Claviceps pusilla TaxID=123648 RepID=A0A9P7N8C4_9HYPO|nr:hypothetical protein E4U43_001079 [Claviceps pusilla]
MVVRVSQRRDEAAERIATSSPVGSSQDGVWSEIQAAQRLGKPNNPSNPGIPASRHHPPLASPTTFPVPCLASATDQLQLPGGVGQFCAVLGIQPQSSKWVEWSHFSATTCASSVTGSNLIANTGASVVFRAQILNVAPRAACS